MQRRSLTPSAAALLGALLDANPTVEAAHIRGLMRELDTLAPGRLAAFIAAWHQEKADQAPKPAAAHKLGAKSHSTTAPAPFSVRSAAEPAGKAKTASHSVPTKAPGTQPSTVPTRARPRGIQRLDRARRRLLVRVPAFLPLVIARLKADTGVDLAATPKSARASLPKLYALAEERGLAGALIAAGEAIAKERSLAYDMA